MYVCTKHANGALFLCIFNTVLNSSFSAFICCLFVLTYNVGFRKHLK